MKTKLKPSSLFTLTLGLGILAAVGCDVTEKDVSSARDKVREEQRETAEVQREGQQDIGEKEQELADARHTAGRPTYDENDKVADAKEELAEAKQKAAENTADEKQETAEAEQKADKMAAELKATKARDAYVAGLNTKLEAYDIRIEAKKDSLENLEGVALETAKTELEAMRKTREILSDAIYEIKNSEVMTWESKKATAEQMLEKINRDMK